MKSGALPFNVVAFVAMNPEVRLTTAEIAALWNVDHKRSVATILAGVTNAGYLDKQGPPRGGRGALVTFGIGPRLAGLKRQ